MTTSFGEIIVSVACVHNAEYENTIGMEHILGSISYLITQHNRYDYANVYKWQNL